MIIVCINPTFFRLRPPVTQIDFAVPGFSGDSVLRYGRYKLAGTGPQYREPMALPLPMDTISLM